MVPLDDSQLILAALYEYCAARFQPHLYVANRYGYMTVDEQMEKVAQVQANIKRAEELRNAVISGFLQMADGNVVCSDAPLFRKAENETPERRD